jgi:hypothetical protein
MTPGTGGASVYLILAITLLVVCVICDWLAAETETLDDDDPRGY